MSLPRLLFVCTANQCRSAMAEAIARDLAQRSGRMIATASAGVRAREGVDATEQTVRALHRIGVELTNHSSRLLTPEHLAQADLVLCMERDHLLAIDDLGGEFARTFTVPELAATATAIGPEPFDTWDRFLDAANHDRTPATGLAAPEVEDPTGRSARHHRATARELQRDLTAILAVVPT